MSLHILATSFQKLAGLYIYTLGLLYFSFHQLVVCFPSLQVLLYSKVFRFAGSKCLRFLSIVSGVLLTFYSTIRSCASYPSRSCPVLKCLPFWIVEVSSFLEYSEWCLLKIGTIMAIMKGNVIAGSLGLALTVAMSMTVLDVLGATLVVENDYGLNTLVQMECNSLNYNSGPINIPTTGIWKLDIDEVKQGNNPVHCYFQFDNRCADFIAWYNSPAQTSPSKCGVPVGDYTDCLWHITSIGFDLDTVPNVHVWAPCPREG